MRGIVLRTRHFVVEALQEAALRGEVRRDVPAEELALAVLGAIFARALFDDGRASLWPAPDAAWSHLHCLIKSWETTVGSSLIEGVRS